MSYVIEIRVSLVLFSGNLENGCWLSFVGEEEKETVGCLLFRKFPLVHRQRLFSQLGFSRSEFEAGDHQQASAR